MKYRWSDFTVRYILPNGKILVKNFFTRSVVLLGENALKKLDRWLENQQVPEPELVRTLCGKNELLVPDLKDEFQDYRDTFLDTRNNQARLFTLHFLPTMNCQLNCSYCFEKGSRQKMKMSEGVLNQSIDWLEKYLTANPEVSSFRCALFGGEPLLAQSLIKRALPRIKSLSENAGKKYWTEITTNGEFFDEDIAGVLKQNNLKRVQITLDGPKRLHDRRRLGKDKHPTFDKIIANVKMLLDGEYIPQVSLRISLDEETADLVPELIQDLGQLGYGDRIHLSLGLIVPSMDNETKVITEKIIAEKAVEAWRTAQKVGFSIPDEFLVGPWCVAIAKHSVVIQPNGGLQKCFCTVGRELFDFGKVWNTPTSYTKDARFEDFYRTEKCVSEKCPYLPVCGGGCIHDSIVKNGENGFHDRFCQKELISTLNRGLLFLKYTR